MIDKTGVQSVVGSMPIPQQQQISHPLHVFIVREGFLRYLSYLHPFSKMPSEGLRKKFGRWLRSLFVSAILGDFNLPYYFILCFYFFVNNSVTFFSYTF